MNSILPMGTQVPKQLTARSSTAAAGYAPDHEPLQRPHSTPRIDAARLMKALHESCEFGKAFPWGKGHTETGMARLALSDDDKRVRDWLKEQATDIGCKVTFDQIGNMFAVLPGKNSLAAPTMMGSHLDTQPTGGRYDGILGVLSALEILKTLQETGYQTEGSIGLVNWTNEEGSRFPKMALGSSVWAGLTPLGDAWNCQEVVPTQGDKCYNVKEELKRIGYLGKVPASSESQPIGAHFELHIEQGPILEQEKRKVGVVTGAQAFQWYTVEVRGKDSHAGTTPLTARKDALLAAARMIVESNRLAKSSGGLITTGTVQANPSSINTVAHTASFTLDMRHVTDQQLSDMVRDCRESFDRIALEEALEGKVQWERLAATEVTQFHPDCIQAVEQSAEEVCDLLVPGGASEQRLWKRMMSGAGHDSCQVARRSPAAMVFAPTWRGMSHTPDEYCSPEDCAIGAQVLLGAVLRYDQLRASRGEFS